MLPRCHSRWLCPSSLHAPILMHSPLLLLQPPSLLLSLTPNLSNLSPNPPSNATCSVVLFHAPHPFASSSIFTTSSSQATWKHFFKYTRPKPAYGRQGLDCDRWARIQFSHGGVQLTTLVQKRDRHSRGSS